MGPKSFLFDVRSELQKNKYNVVVLQLGNNDIDKARDPASIRALVQQYTQEVANMCSALDIKAILCTEVPRGSQKYPTHASKCDQFNTLLAQCVEELGQQNMYVWKHKGLFKPKGSTLCRDQVHLNEQGMRRYLNSIRASTRFSFKT